MWKLVKGSSGLRIDVGKAALQLLRGVHFLVVRMYYFVPSW